MALQLIVSNPPKSTKRTKRGRKVRRRRSRVRSNPAGVNMAQKSRRRRRRGGGGIQFTRRKRRSSSRRRRTGRALGGFVNTSVLTGAAVGVGGYALTNYALGWLPAGWLDSGMKRVAVKAGVAIAAGLVVRKLLRKPALGNGIAVGGLIAAGVDAARQYNVPGVSGLGEFGIGDVSSFEFTQLPPSTIPGLGCFPLPSSAAPVR